MAWSLESITPDSSAWVRLSLERHTVPPITEGSGSLIADAVFLLVPSQTALPVFTEEPPRRMVVKVGDPVNLNLSMISPDATSHQWYHNGAKSGTAEDLSLIASPASAGTYFVVATNSAGPVIGAITELTVLDAGTDTDGDGISDTDEANVFGTNPILADSDGDGHSDYEELFLTRTNPTSAASTFRVTQVEVIEGRFGLTFDSVPGVSYGLQASTNLIEWIPVGSAFVATETTTTSLDSQTVSVGPPRFLRVAVNP